jgi:hypothetical protein
MVVLVWSFIDYKPVAYGKLAFPGWAQGFGWAILISALLLIPIMAVWTYFHMKKPQLTFKENLLRTIKPNDKWAPHEYRNRTGRYTGKVLAHDISAIISHRTSRNQSPNNRIDDDVFRTDHADNTFPTPFIKSQSFQGFKKKVTKKQTFSVPLDDRPTVSQMI